eukprot:scaffold17685_cov169-Amphora_coffeaeformis.AAC.8
MSSAEYADGNSYPRSFVELWKRHGGVSERDIQALTIEAQTATASSGRHYPWQTEVNKSKEKLAIRKLHERFPHGLPQYCFAPPAPPQPTHQSTFEITANFGSVQVGDSASSSISNVGIGTSTAHPTIENGSPPAASARNNTNRTPAALNDSTVQAAAAPAQLAAATTLATSLTQDATKDQDSSRRPAIDGKGKRTPRMVRRRSSTKACDE